MRPIGRRDQVLTPNSSPRLLFNPDAQRSAEFRLGANSLSEVANRGSASASESHLLIG
jgi:hypothetical protein